MKHPIIITSNGKIERRIDYDSIFSKLLSSSTGRQSLAQSMVAPIRARLNYQSIAHKVFSVQQLPSGALPSYDKDIVSERYKYDAIKINSRGVVYRKNSLSGTGRRVIFPTFQLVSNPTIKISSIKHRRFDIIDRSVNKLKQSMMAEEDSRVFEVLDKLGK